MKNLLKYSFLLIIFFSSIKIYALSLTESAKERGINQTCLAYLNQIEENFGLNGLNITFAHPDNPSLYPSLHFSTQNYNNGASSFSITLSPDNEKCFLSTIASTSIDGQNCNQIAELKIKQDETLKLDSYSNNNYKILTPRDNSYQIILTSSGDKSCLMTETRMIWPDS